MTSYKYFPYGMVQVLDIAHFRIAKIVFVA